MNPYYFVAVAVILIALPLYLSLWNLGRQTASGLSELEFRLRRVEDVLANAESCSPEQMANEILTDPLSFLSTPRVKPKQGSDQ